MKNADITIGVANTTITIFKEKGVIGEILRIKPTAIDIEFINERSGSEYVSLDTLIAAYEMTASDVI